MTSRRSRNAHVNDLKFVELSTNLTDFDNDTILNQIEMIDDWILEISTIVFFQ